MRTALAVIVGISVIAGTATIFAYPMALIAVVRLQPAADVWMLDGASE